MTEKSRRGCKKRKISSYLFENKENSKNVATSSPDTDENLRHFERLGFKYYPSAVPQRKQEALGALISKILDSHRIGTGRNTRSSGPLPFEAKYGTESWVSSNAFNRAVDDPNECVLSMNGKTIRVWDRQPADSYKNSIPARYHNHS